MALILIIDDDRDVRRTLRTMLDKLGHEAVAAAGWGAGRQALKAQAFDLVISDIYMPDTDGFEVIKALREDWPDLPILAISGSAAGRTLDVLHYATMLGATRVLDKPFRKEALKAHVDACLHDSRMPVGARDRRRRER